jgi:hypothetical protein
MKRCGPFSGESLPYLKNALAAFMRFIPTDCAWVDAEIGPALCEGQNPVYGSTSSPLASHFSCQRSRMRELTVVSCSAA